MPNNPFKQQKNFANSPKRNTFDLSFSNNASFNFGTLYPVFCKETLPGDSWSINPSFALRAVPLLFPIQTRCRAHLHFFHVYTRNLWDGFMDFINGNKTPVDIDDTTKSPFISDDVTPDLFRTGSLGDYLGVPTISNTVSDNSVPFDLNFNNNVSLTLSGTVWTVRPPLRGFFYPAYSETAQSNYLLPVTKQFYVTSDYNAGSHFGEDFYYISSNKSLIGDVPVSGTQSINGSYFSGALQSNFYQILPFATKVGLNLFNHRVQVKFNSKYYRLTAGVIPQLLIGNSGSVENPSISDYRLYDVKPMKVHTSVVASDGSIDYTLYCDLVNYSSSSSSNCFVPVASFTQEQNVAPKVSDFVFNIFSLGGSGDYIDQGSHVFFGQDSISALPFRAYESIYNSFYRDQRNNPFIPFGSSEELYNEFLPSKKGGLDSYPYRLYKRNWELDMFTSCVQSPQQGTAPLVGISSLGEVTFNDNGKSYTFSSEIADDADTITNVKVTENVPNSVARSIVNLVSSGISINDFRNVNAFQRWKETNIRRGLKYKDQIKARWNTDIEYNVLDMPEFLGGVSCDIDVNSVSQTAETSTSPLGAYAGQATAFGSTKNTIIIIVGNMVLLLVFFLLFLSPFIPLVSCPGCNEAIREDDDLETIEYIKTRRGTEIFLHRGCVGKVWKGRGRQWID